MSEIINKLKDGVRQFQANVYKPQAEAYRKAASEPQRPHTLVVACADSRVNVEAITSSRTGDVFITRNIGNMVPAYQGTLGGVSAVIEYAVNALKVQHVVVCGHSDCGAMKALLNPPSTDTLPIVRTWLNNGHAALSIAETVHKGTGREMLSVLTEQNVLMQMAHLKTHPSVAGAMARRELTISGWVYEIGSGEVRIVEDGQQKFIPVGEAKAEHELTSQP